MELLNSSQIIIKRVALRHCTMDETRVSIRWLKERTTDRMHKIDLKWSKSHTGRRAQLQKAIEEKATENEKRVSFFWE